MKNQQKISLKKFACTHFNLVMWDYLTAIKETLQTNKQKLKVKKRLFFQLQGRNVEVKQKQNNSETITSKRKLLGMKS